MITIQLPTQELGTKPVVSFGTTTRTSQASRAYLVGKIVGVREFLRFGQLHSTNHMPILEYHVDRHAAHWFLKWVKRALTAGIIAILALFAFTSYTYCTYWATMNAYERWQSEKKFDDVNAQKPCWFSDEQIRLDSLPLGLKQTIGSNPSTKIVRIKFRGRSTGILYVVGSDGEILQCIPEFSF
jgi:hypothetical protein